MTQIFITVNPGFYNKGDAAIVIGAIETLKNKDNSEIYLISSHPEFDSIRCNAKLIIDNEYISKKRIAIVRELMSKLPIVQHLCLAISYRIFDSIVISKGIMKSEIWKQYNKSDIIVAALNDSFTTLYGSSSFLININTILISRLLRKKTVLYACSIGPFKNKYFEIIGRYILNKVDLITLREDVSLNYLKKIGVNKPSIYVTADLAFALPPASLTRGYEILSFEGINEKERPLIGMSLSRVISRWSFPEIRDLDEKYKEYLKSMAILVDYIIEKYSANIIFIPQVIGHSIENDDRITANNIYKLSKNNNNIKLITKEYSPQDLRAITGIFDMFIGARTHSIISAAIMSTPFIALEYESHKTRGIIGHMMDCKEFVYDIRTLKLNTLLEKIDNVWQNRSKIRDEMKQKINGIEERALLNGQLVREILLTK